MSALQRLLLPGRASHYLFICLSVGTLGSAKRCQTPPFIQQGKCKHSLVTEAVATATGIVLARVGLITVISGIRNGVLN